MENPKIYDVFISYSHKDRLFASQLNQALTSLGVSTFVDYNDFLVGYSWAQQNRNTISSCKIFIPIITESYLSSDSSLDELQWAMARSKRIIPVCFDSSDFFQKSDISKDARFSIKHALLGIVFLTVKDGSPEEINRLAERISVDIFGKKTENQLFEKASEYIRAGATDKATECLCELIKNTCEQIHKSSSTQRRENIYTLLTLLEKLCDIYDYDYSKESSRLAHLRIDTVCIVNKIMSLEEFLSNDLFYISTALRLIYFDREIRWTSIDTITHGDLSDGIIDAVPESEYFLKQQPYLERYRIETIRQNLDDPSRYTADELLIIREAEKYVYNNISNEKTEKRPISDTTKEDELLFAVASFMNEGNNLFNVISEQQCADEFLRCLILSYERLQKYCEAIGEKKVCAECISRIFELKEKLKSNRNTRETNKKAQDGIKSLLGLTVPKSGNFDVFISHKKEDYDIASDIYDFLKNRMKEPFFDKYSLPEMSESKYRKAIMLALDGSKHFVVVLSDLSYLESYWVSLEMEIFQSEIDEGRKPNSNFLLIVTDNVYREIMSSNKAVLPIEYRRCEIIKVDEYKNKLLSYINK